MRGELENRFYELAGAVINQAIDDYIIYCLVSGRKMYLYSDNSYKEVERDGQDALYFLFCGGVDTWLELHHIDFVNPEAIRQHTIKLLHDYLDRGGRNTLRDFAKERGYRRYASGQKSDEVSEDTAAPEMATV